MYLTNIFITGFCLFSSLVHCIPTSPIPQGSELSIREEFDSLIESKWDANEASLYYDLIDMFSDEDFLFKRADNDDSYQSTINSVLETINSSGVIWDLLDAIADHPDRIEYLTNLTSSLLGGTNITIDVADILNGDSSLSSLTQFINVSAIFNAVMDSGLVTSLADGLLLDADFRPKLADIVNRVGWSLRDPLLYIFNSVFQKRDLLLKRADGNDLSVWSSLLRAAEDEVSGSSTTNQATTTAARTTNTANPSSFSFSIDPNVLSSILSLNSQVAQTQSSSSQRSTSSSSRAASSSSSRAVSSSSSASSSSASSAASSTRSSSRAVESTTSSSSNSVSSSEYSGSLGSFVENAAGTILGSNIVGNIATDVLNALNDTGFAVYFVKRFLSDDAYVNMTGALASSLLSSGTININTEGVNITGLVDQVLGDPSAIVSTVGSLLSGDSSALSGTLGKYSGALQSLLGDIEATGLFARLNNYIFGSSSSSSATQATTSASSSSSAKKDVVSASATATSKSSEKKQEVKTSVVSVSPTNSAVSRSSNSSNDASGVAGNGFTMKALFLTQAVLLVGVFAF
ncbi:hypothetical protein CANMA_004601 [Candida margitis]|uniref:uncharacterized protein n=1 Tax=Candida margitis TaxID=1775924 RepID=UPI0022279879|nr:uncharacterized protein CANMA_004601 [Candida margitis]KAI5955421.1 hypothetical protein CANMA_004601 [Candida margitis]